MKTTKRILFIQPGEKHAMGYRYPPISFMFVASYLQKNGYKVEIFDARHKGLNELNLSNVLFVGISIVTGSRIINALEIAKYIRRKNPSITLVWAGIHATLLPEETARNEYVDIVVKNEGEETILELADRFSNNESIEDVQGIVYKDKNGEIINNPNRPYMDLSKLEYPSFDLLDMKEYEKTIIHLNSSRGCPFPCTFCYLQNFNKLSWRAIPADLLVNWIDKAVNTYGMKEIGFSDDNFFVDKKRVEAFCNGLIDKGLNKKIKWGAIGRFDTFARYDDNIMSLLKESNFWSLAGGAESGSPRMLKVMKKMETKELVEQGISNCANYGFRAIPSFVIGFPQEKREDVEMTLDYIDELMKYSNFSTNGIFLFTPYPGTPDYEDAVKLGYKPPKNLEEWGRFYFCDINNLTWFDEDYKKYLLAINKVGDLLFAQYSPYFEFKPDYFLKSAAKFTLMKMAWTRWRLKFFKVPYELIAFDRYTTPLK